MFIVGDLLMFITTSLVLSITCLCVLLHVRGGDRLTQNLLLVLVPLCLQMCLTLLTTYIKRVYPPAVFEHPWYATFALWITCSSIVLTSALLLTLSRYLVDLLPASERNRTIGHRVTYIIVILFMLLSFFFVIGTSRGDWPVAMEITITYHFFAGSMLMVVHGITSLFYIRKASSWEQESLLKGIAIAFLPLVVTFPLDIIFFKNHVFKLAYLEFSVLVVYLYFFINRQWFSHYKEPRTGWSLEAVQQTLGLSPREAQIVQLLVAGKTNVEIGTQLFISTNTVKTHVKNIYTKLQVSNRVQLYAKIDAMMAGDGLPSHGQQ